MYSASSTANGWHPVGRGYPWIPICRSVSTSCKSINLLNKCKKHQFFKQIANLFNQWCFCMKLRPIWIENSRRRPGVVLPGSIRVSFVSCGRRFRGKLVGPSNATVTSTTLSTIVLGIPRVVVSNHCERVHAVLEDHDVQLQVDAVIQNIDLSYMIYRT